MGVEVVPYLIAASVATGVYAVTESRKAAKEGKSEAKKQRQLQDSMFARDLEAGEYFEQLRAEQMELQSQSATIKTLSDLIEARRQPTSQQIITLPPAKEYSAVERINRAIGEMIKG